MALWLQHRYVLGLHIVLAVDRQLEEVGKEAKEVVADKGYHSNATMVALDTRPVRSYVNEPHRGRRSWKANKSAQQPSYANRRRMKGAWGKLLSRKRSEIVARTFVDLLNTGGLRRVHVRGQQEILKRLLIQAAGYNLGLLMRTRFGVGKPRSLQGVRSVQWVLGGG